jgi:hypothetical protein
MFNDWLIASINHVLSVDLNDKIMERLGKIKE